MTTTIEQVEVSEAELRTMRGQPPLLPKERWRSPRHDKLDRVQTAAKERSTPFGKIRLAWAPLIALPLVVAPRLRPLRGKPVNDWRIEILLAPSEKPTPKWRRYMRDRFGQALCGLYRTTANPNNPLPQSIDGWWWHGGVWTSGELASGLVLGKLTKQSILGIFHQEPARISNTEMQRLSVWLEGKAEGQTYD